MTRKSVHWDNNEPPKKKWHEHWDTSIQFFSHHCCCCWSFSNEFVAGTHVHLTEHTTDTEKNIHQIIIRHKKKGRTCFNSQSANKRWRQAISCILFHFHFLSGSLLRFFATFLYAFFRSFSFVRCIFFFPCIFGTFFNYDLIWPVTTFNIRGLSPICFLFASSTTYVLYFSPFFHSWL